MTEFSYIGKNCAFKDCGQYDFLPFQCDGCKKNFCLDHRTQESHNCEKYEEKNRIVPKCPICQARIIVPPNSNRQHINRIVNAHIENSCKTYKVKKPKIKFCDRKDCSNKAEIKCNICKKLFCLFHRHTFEHQCIVRKEDPPENYFFTRNNPKTRKKKKITQVKSYKKIKGRIKFQNNVHEAKGNPNIERKDRFYMDVFFPVDSNIRPLHCFFNKRQKIGKILDLISEFGNITNDNNVETNDSKRLHLFSLTNSFVLVNKDTLREVENQGILKNGDPVILERGTKLRSDLRGKCLGAINNETESGCSIC